MSNRFIKQSRQAIIGVCATAALTGFYACSDSYDLDEKGNNPSWLGKSIYEELENPGNSGLEGTFNNYLRLIDDLGYKEVMAKTGSKTVFVANDSAFAEFFKNNSWGVKSYEELTEPMKKQLFYASVLDNAILTEMLSNVDNNGTTVARGIALKHQTSANATDTIYHFYNRAVLPQNNSYWDKYTKGIDVVMDNTRPMMVHFTQEQMINNSITENDFQVITGRAFTNGATFIFNREVKVKDITCLNGYINQTDGVIVPPGNMAQMIREGSDTKLFSRMLDRFCAPYYDAATTLNYNDYAFANGKDGKDSIFQWRYFSDRSQGATALTRDPNGVTIAEDMRLAYDPGWNQYYSTIGNNLADIGAMFVPTDAAVTDYFTNPTKGGYKILNLYAKLPNTVENLETNLDSIPGNIVRQFVNNMMNASFVQSVPSKFNTIMDEASDPIGITLDQDIVNKDGKYDVRIANNGVLYMLDRVVPPISYNIVSTPALLRKFRDLGVINWAIQDKSTLNANFYAYLRASTANYAMFLPNNEAFDAYYVDPVSLGKHYSGGPRVLHFYYKDVNKDNNISVSSFKYDPSNGTIGQDSATVGLSGVADRLVDILNYHTISLPQGETFGNNHFYKTKHGGEIRLAGNKVGGQVYSGAQINGKLGANYQRDKSTITELTNDYSNGCSYVINRIIEAPQTSVYGCLTNYSKFSDFMDLCVPSDISSVLTWLGIDTKNQKQFTVFNDEDGDCIDYNVAFFNTYNYTLYAPNNDAMKLAHQKGLPTWDQVKKFMETHEHDTGTALEDAKAEGLAMVETIRNFIRYHFQDVSLYADNNLEYGDAPDAPASTGVKGGKSFTTSCVNDNVYQKLTISGGNGHIYVKDAVKNDPSHGSIDIDMNDNNKLVNLMTRDYWFNSGLINTSSFAVVHEISSPLCYNETFSYGDWNLDTTAAKLKRANRMKALQAAQKRGEKFFK